MVPTSLRSLAAWNVWHRTQRRLSNPDPDHDLSGLWVKPRQKQSWSRKASSAGGFVFIGARIWTVQGQREDFRPMNLTTTPQGHGPNGATKKLKVSSSVQQGRLGFIWAYVFLAEAKKEDFRPMTAIEIIGKTPCHQKQNQLVLETKKF